MTYAVVLEVRVRVIVVVLPLCCCEVAVEPDWSVDDGEEDVPSL